MTSHSSVLLFFFFNDTATTEIYTLSLHDALPISFTSSTSRKTHKRGISGSTSTLCFLPLTVSSIMESPLAWLTGGVLEGDRKSTRLNSSHSQKSYAVFCLKKKNTSHQITAHPATH